MAKNLLAKISDSDTLLVSDRQPGAVERFVADLGGTKGLEVVNSTKEVAERSVSRQSLFCT